MKVGAGIHLKWRLVWTSTAAVQVEQMIKLLSTTALRPKPSAENITHRLVATKRRHIHIHLSLRAIRVSQLPIGRLSISSPVPVFLVYLILEKEASYEIFVCPSSSPPTVPSSRLPSSSSSSIGYKYLNLELDQ